MAVRGEASLSKIESVVAAIAERLDDARRRGFWHPRRNDIDAALAILRAEALA